MQILSYYLICYFARLFYIIFAVFKYIFRKREIYVLRLYNKL